MRVQNVRGAARAKRRAYQFGAVEIFMYSFETDIEILTEKSFFLIFFGSNRNPFKLKFNMEYFFMVLPAADRCLSSHQAGSTCNYDGTRTIAICPASAPFE